MPLGLQRPDSAIGSAIEYAAQCGRLMFAPASVDSQDRARAISWPAWHQDVICVHAGSTEGEPSQWTPAAQDDMTIMLLGENVESACPPHLLFRDNKMYMTGTACATVLAAGVAVMLLDFAEIILDEKAQKLIRQTVSMRNVFSEMAQDTGTHAYSWVKPWEMFNSGQDVSTIERFIKAAIGYT